MSRSSLTCVQDFEGFPALLSEPLFFSLLVGNFQILGIENCMQENLI